MENPHDLSREELEGQELHAGTSTRGADDPIWDGPDNSVSSSPARKAHERVLTESGRAYATR